MAVALLESRATIGSVAKIIGTSRKFFIGGD
jgi:hypothetical protein